MNPLRWQQIKEVFWELAPIPAEERECAIASACAGDSELERNVRELLTDDARDPDTWSAAALLGLAEPSRDEPQIAGFRMGVRLGDSLTSEVYRATQLDLGRDVAIKIFREAIETPDAQHIAREATALSRLKHPCIAQVFSAGVARVRGEPAPYLVIEFVDGATITRFAQDRRANARERAALLARVCEAVQHAHGRGVIHRDLKPENILVEINSSQEATPKVLDFGLASIIGGASTSRLAFAGTPAYMAPELLRGETITPDVRGDVYALGAIGYELLMGRPPAVSGGMTLPEALAAVDSFDPRPDLAAHGDLGAIVLRAMQRDPAERYQSSAELAADLRRLLAGEPITVRANEPLYMLRMAAKRRPVLSAVIAATATTLVVSLGVVSYSHARNQEVLKATSDAARILLTEAADTFADRAGAGATRRRSLEQLLPQIEQFTIIAPDNRAVRMDYARVLHALGDLEADQAHFEKAEEFLRRSLAIRESLASRPDATAEDRSLLSIALVRVGDIAGAHRLFQEQRSFYERALSIDQSLVTQFPASPHFASNLAFSYERLGELARTQGDIPNAVRYHGMQTALVGTLESLGESPSKARWAVMSAKSMLPALLELRGLPEQALEARQDLVRDLESYVREDPGSKPLRMRLCSALLSVSSTFGSRGDETSAMHTAQRAVEVLTPLETSDPHDAVVLSTLADAWGGLARRRVAAGDNAGAIEALRRSEAFLDSLLVLSPPSSLVLRSAAGLRGNAAEYYRAAGSEPDAARAWRSQLAHIRAYVALSDERADKLELMRTLAQPSRWTLTEAAECSALARECLAALDPADLKAREEIERVLSLASIATTVAK